MRRNAKILVGLLTVLAALVLGAGGIYFFAYAPDGVPEMTVPDPPDAVAPPGPSRPEVSGWSSEEDRTTDPSQPNVEVPEEAGVPAVGGEGPGETTVPADVSPPASPDETPFRAVWVASVLNLDYPSKTGLSVDALKQEALRVLDDAVDIGFNAVILQVRPTGDALYRSEVFPWSASLTGTQGQVPAGGFDPLAFWVDEAHKRGLALHAWINPFRVTTGGHDLASLSADNPARLHPDWVVAYRDGRLYYNPGLPDVRRLIVSGVTELVRRYAIDGVHYDDYFYPGADFPDDAAYAAHGAGFSRKDDWRRDNINRLIRDTQKAVKDLRSDCRFGVSPFGIWANRSSQRLGSDTRGQESYSVHFADTRQWVKSGWLDYICPQLYWHIGYDVADYQILLDWWRDVVRDTGVDLYIGHADYRVGTGESPADPWYNADEIVRQLTMNAAAPEVAGNVHFRYGFFAEKGALYRAVKGVYRADAGPGDALSPTAPATSAAPQEEEIPTGAPAETPPASAPSGSGAPVAMPTADFGTLALGRPSKNVSTSDSSYYILGVSDPAQALSVNGKAVDGRGAGGAFGVLVSLERGANKFTFKQGSRSVSVTITRTSSASSSSPERMDRAEIEAQSVVPSGGEEYGRPGETVTLRCKAPIGADVTVTLGGESFPMEPAVKQRSSGGGYYATTYTYKYILPDTGVTGRIVTVGTPVYTMAIDGRTSTRTARAVKCLPEGAPYCAQVVAETAYVYAKASTSGGPQGELSRGQRDNITAVTGGGAWVRLAMGGWVSGDDVTRTEETQALANRLTGAVYARGQGWDTLTLSGSVCSATQVEYDGKTLTFTVYGAQAAPSASLPAGTPFVSFTAARSGANAVYTGALRAGERLDGYYVTAAPNGTLVLHIKRHPRAGGGTKPLTGLVILVDPGHGGGESGALGPFGDRLPEKTINLYTALKLRWELERLGATVVMTRTEDTTMSLAARVARSRALRPDLFLSVHGNSLDSNVDASNISGLSTWYRNRVGQDAAEALYDFAPDALGRGGRGCHQSNLYVARPAWTPSFIVETGFLCNPAEAEWMADNEAQTRLARTLAEGVLAYFQT
ncbi:MAG: family 10 glycosylhydrolase [Oscillospiraceae bacterium]|nr:family 10 glycosylhydrolase [Oscillospiraceae bacterium]